MYMKITKIRIKILTASTGTFRELFTGNRVIALVQAPLIQLVPWADD